MPLPVLLMLLLLLPVRGIWQLAELAWNFGRSKTAVAVCRTLYDFTTRRTGGFMVR
jgi:hypothetical protein